MKNGDSQDFKSLNLLRGGESRKATRSKSFILRLITDCLICIFFPFSGRRSFHHFHIAIARLSFTSRFVFFWVKHWELFCGLLSLKQDAIYSAAVKFYADDSCSSWQREIKTIPVRDGESTDDWCLKRNSCDLLSWWCDRVSLVWLRKIINRKKITTLKLAPSVTLFCDLFWISQWTLLKLLSAIYNNHHFNITNSFYLHLAHHAPKCNHFNYIIISSWASAFNDRTRTMSASCLSLLQKHIQVYSN